MKVLIRSFFVFVLLCATANATQLRGHVTDRSGAGIPHARIDLRTPKHFLTTSADDYGSFELQTTDSEGSITVCAPGFSPLTRPWHDSPQPVIFTLEPESLAQKIIVIAERSETPLSGTAANIRSLTYRELDTHAAFALDDALRQVPGFTIFRRSSSLSANPTTQGASARGIGASGASRMLVLQDSIPLNDAFGGWVYWDRNPRMALDRVEILRGAGSNLYGNSALAGVVAMRTLPPANLISVEASGDSLSGHDVQGDISDRFSGWTLSAIGEIFGNAGFFLVEPADRGLADAKADLQFSNGRVRLQRTFGQGGEVFASGSLFTEERGNGTLLQVNGTHLGELTTGLDAINAYNRWTVRLFGTGENYRQSFSSISVDRDSESLVRWQTVPSSQFGFSAQWTHLFPNVRISLGTDGRFIHGESDETIFTSGVVASAVSAGGANHFAGVFGEISKSFLRRLHLSASIRNDWWSNDNAFTRTTVLQTGITASKDLSAHHERALSPRAGVVYDVMGPLQITASVYRSFRAPTLNELYRAFRLGNILTIANEQLRAERLVGGESGLRYARSHLLLNAVFFYAHVDDPIANVTLSSTLPLILRQRQNMGALRSQGVDADLLLMLPRIQISSGYEYANSKVVSFSADSALVGKSVPQVPAHVFTLSTFYSAPHRWSFDAILRISSQQFDDDQNLFVLNSYSTVGVSISKSLGQTTWFVSASNLFNSKVEAAATPIPTFASPRIFSVGIRAFYGRK